MIILPDDRLIIEMLTPEDAKRVFLALVSDGEPELSPEARIVYTVICERNRRISAQKAAAGTMGGAPLGNKNASKQPREFQTSETSETSKTTKTSTGVEKQAKQPSESVTDTDTDTEM